MEDKPTPTNFKPLRVRQGSSILDPGPYRWIVMCRQRRRLYYFLFPPAPICIYSYPTASISWSSSTPTSEPCCIRSTFAIIQFSWPKSRFWNLMPWNLCMDPSFSLRPIYQSPVMAELLSVRHRPVLSNDHAVAGNWFCGLGCPVVCCYRRTPKGETSWGIRWRWVKGYWCRVRCQWYRASSGGHMYYC